MKHAIVRIMGHNQDWGKPNGFHDRRKEDSKKYEGREDVVVFECLRWKDDMRVFAEKLLNYGIRQIHIVGHSHGIGKGTVSLIKEVKKINKTLRKAYTQQAKKNKKLRGLPHPQEMSIVTVNGNDAVVYPKLLGFIPIPKKKIFKPLLYRSLTPWPRIKFPKNSVRHLYGLRQSNRIPKGQIWKMGKVKFEPSIENIDEDGWSLVHHDADPEKKERDFDESIVSRNLELQVFSRHVG